MKYRVRYKMHSISRKRGWTEFAETLDRRELNDFLEFVEASDGRYIILSIVPHEQKG